MPGDHLLPDPGDGDVVGGQDEGGGTRRGAPLGGAQRHREDRGARQVRLGPGLGTAAALF